MPSLARSRQLGETNWNGTGRKPAQEPLGQGAAAQAARVLRPAAGHNPAPFDLAQTIPVAGLRPAYGAVSIRAMLLSRRTTRFVAVLAGAFVLLCQTAMAAQACGLALAASEGSSLSESCHGIVPQSGDAPGHVQQQNCPSEYASASFAKLDIPQAADLPGLVVQPVWLLAAVRDGLISIALPARAEPPPLTILHCCLRN